MEFINEYLAIIDEEVNSALYVLCDNKEQLKKIIQESKQFKILRNQILSPAYKCGFNINIGEVRGKKQRFFYIKFKEKEEKDLKEYKNLLRDFKKILNEKNIILEVLRDDISFHYATLAYPSIHKIENLMRKFILYFMIVAIGKEWKNKSNESIKKRLNSEESEYKNKIQELSFGELGEFLFNTYHEYDRNALIDKLKSLEDVDELLSKDFSELKSFIPKSNWDKYFKIKIECEDNYLPKRWKELTELRNKVAHNKTFSESDLFRVEQLSKEVTSEIEKALKSIEKLELDQFEKDTVSEEIISSLNSSAKTYFDIWKDIMYYFPTMKSVDKESFEKQLKELMNKNFIDEDLYNKLNNMYFTRNYLLHNTDIDNSSYLIQTDDIEKLKKELSMSWKEEIVNAFKANDDTLTLDQIYKYIENHTIRDLPVSWKSTIRRTIYNYSSDADIYLGKEDLFQKEGRGKWKLKK